MLGSRRSSCRNCLVLALPVQMQNLFGAAYWEHFGRLAWLGLMFYLLLWVLYLWMWQMKTSLKRPLLYSLIYSVVASVFPSEYPHRNPPPYDSIQQAISPLSVPLPFFSLPISKSFSIYVEGNLWYSVPVINYLEGFSYARSEFRVRGKKISDEVFEFVWDLIFCLARESVDCACDTNCIGVNKRMSEVCQSIQNASHHPNIDFFRDFILQVGINHLRRSIHRSCHCFHFLFDMIILWFVDLREVYESIGTGSKVT